MKSAFQIATATCVALLLVSTAATAKDPLLSGSSTPTVVPDKNLANVKGSGPFAAYYGYYGSLAAQYSYYYGITGNNNNAAGLYGLAYNNYLNARDQANYAYGNFNAAAYYAYYGQ